MPRTLTPAMVTALCSPTKRVALLCQMQFGDNTVACWSGIGPLTWNSITFTGVGGLASVSTISEDSTVEAQSVSISLTGIPSTLMSEILYEVRVLGTVSIWLALFDNTGTLISTPVCSYQGKMDVPSIEDNGQTCTVSISLENVLVDLNRPCFRRYTNDDQQIDLAATLTRLSLSPTTVDTGFRFVPGVQELISFWGKSPSATDN